MIFRQPGYLLKTRCFASSLCREFGLVGILITWVFCVIKHWVTRRTALELVGMPDASGERRAVVEARSWNESHIKMSVVYLQYP